MSKCVGKYTHKQTLCKVKYYFLQRHRSLYFGRDCNRSHQAHHLFYIKVKEIDAKYRKLEAGYRNFRGSGRAELTQYIEDIGTKLSQFQQILDARSDISRKHVVCIFLALI